MRLVIEREGGFTIVEDADAITEIDVMSEAVKLTIEVGGDKWEKRIPVADRAEACRVSAAIAARCGTLVEPLSEGPGQAAETASEWVDGEPPKDGRWYVVRGNERPGVVYYNHDLDSYVDDNYYEISGIVAHLPTPIPER